MSKRGTCLLLPLQASLTLLRSNTALGRLVHISSAIMETSSGLVTVSIAFGQPTSKQAAGGAKTSFSALKATTIQDMVMDMVISP